MKAKNILSNHNKRQFTVLLNYYLKIQLEPLQKPPSNKLY